MRNNPIALLLIALCPLTAAAQAPAALPESGSDVAQLRVRIVLSRYQGDERLSMAPYEISVRTEGPSARAQVRMGTQVPVPNVFPSDPQEIPPGKFGFNYRDVGTNIDCIAWPAIDGRFKIDLVLEESSVVLDGADAPNAGPMNRAPLFRQYRSSNTLLLRDGESTQFALASDRISGDTIRVEVSLSVVR